MEHTERGFGLIKFKDSYGCECSLQESSAATLGHIWLGMDKDSKGVAVGPTVDGHTLGARMHLSRMQVAELLPYLQHFAATGELGLPEEADPQPVAGIVRDMLASALQDLSDIIEDQLEGLE